MIKLGELYYTNRGFDLLASSNKITKQLTFLIISSTLSLERKYRTNSKPLILTEATSFHRLLFVYLNTICGQVWLATELLARFRDHP